MLKPLRVGKKQRDSRFFANILQGGGDFSPSPDTIKRHLKSLYKDLVMGNAQQEKYFQYFLGDPRIVNYAIEDLDYIIKTRSIILKGLNTLQAINDPIIYDNMYYNTCVKKITQQIGAYSLLLQNLTMFKNTQDVNHLIAIFNLFANPNYRLLQKAIFD